MTVPKVALFLPSLDGGGAERVFVELANEFARIGCVVHLVLATARGPYLSEVTSAVKLVDLNAGSVFRSLPRLRKYLKDERPNALLSALEHANIVAVTSRILAGRGTRCIVSVRSVPSAVYAESRSVRAWVTLRLSRMLYRYADGIIGNSTAVATDLVETLNVPQQRIRTIYNPLDLPAIERASLAGIDHPWLNSAGAPIILSVGSLTALKGYETLLRAFALLRERQECRLAILGEGPERQRLERLASNLRISGNVLLPGFIRNPFSWMRRAQVFVSSSLTEGCPNALMQALACGTSVVSTNSIGGAAEILESGRWGRLVPIGDAHAMAEAIFVALTSHAKPDVKMRASQFSLNSVARSYLKTLVPDFDPSIRDSTTQCAP